MRSLPLLVAVLFLVGCSKSDPARGPGSAASPTAPAAKILHFGNGTEPQDLDPQIVTGVPENKIVNTLFEGLVAEGATGSDTVGGTAERWEISADGLVYTFHLRPAARWSNGDPVTAADFVGSYRRILTASLAAEYAYKLYHVAGAEDYHRGRIADFAAVGFKALGPHTLEVRLRQPTPFLIESMKHYAWFPVHLPTVEKSGGLARRGTAWTRPENLVGNGPYLLKSWRPNQKIVVTRSPTYWDRAVVKLDEIHFYAAESIETEERMFRTGQLHKTNELPISKIDVYRRDFPASYRQDPYYGVYFYRFNVTKPPLNDKRVRRALALAIDREALVRNVSRGGQIPAYHFCPPSAQYTPEARLKGDVAEAQRLLAEAGFPGGRGFPKIDVLYNTSENHRAIAEALQQMWRRNLGVEIGLTNQEWKVYLDSQDTRSYDLVRAGWIADYTDPNTFMDMWVTDGGNNDTGWSNAEYDRLLAESYTAPTNAARFAYYQRMEALLLDELPVLPIYFYTRVYAIDPKVRWVPNVIDNRAWKFVDLAP
ncbi:MAG: peptide ABC transporter substrate-binding protein [Opitutia bacterium Tous-C1TDCM]|nr:MAG: peptide ABC transporter substrate-binding protein [Opitutae bacterium Tous-C1TDCM]